MKSFLAGALVATVISAGVTYAVASTSSETITACAHKKTGALRILTGKKCKKSERALSWSAGVAQAAQGVAGPKGEPGSPGAQGTPGADGLPGTNGVSQIYYRDFPWNRIETRAWLQVGSIYLPAGTFLVTASLRFLHSGIIDHVTCRYNNAGDSRGLQLSDRSSAQESIMTIQNHFHLESPELVSAECFAAGTGDVDVQGTAYAIATDSVITYTELCPASENDVPENVDVAVC